MNAPSRHVPVLLDEVVAALAPQTGETYVDGTAKRPCDPLTAIVLPLPLEAETRTPEPKSPGPVIPV